jgi:PST family polysaccharide transporter
MQATIACASRLLMVRHGMLPLLAQQELKDLLRFGVGATASLVVNSLARYGDNFVVGRSMGAAALGLYDRAYSLMNLPFSYGAGVISGVLFPALAQVQTEPDRMRRGYLLATQVTAMIAAPVMGGMAVAAPHLVVSVYGAQWTSTILPLQILCAAGYFRSLYHVGGIVAHSAGRVYNELWRQIVYAALVVVGATFGARYGLPGVAFGVSFAIMYMFVATGHLALRVTRTPWRSYLRAQIVGLMTGAVTCGVAMAVRWYLERLAASSPVITISIIASCGITWGLCLMWRIGEPEFAELRAKLPPNYLRLIGRVRRLPLAAPGAE